MRDLPVVNGIRRAKKGQTMEIEQFDTFTRRLGGAAPSRRDAVRSLGAIFLGGALAGVAARTGLVEGAEAKSGAPKGKRKTKHAHHTAAKPEARPRPGGVQAEGKGKHKNKNKRPKHPKDPNPADPPCPDGQGQCADGACLPFDQCCSDQYRCADGSCVNIFDCCPEEKRCDANLCILKHLCCPDDLPPLCGECEEAACVNGHKVCQPSTCQKCPVDFVDCPLYGCCPADHYFPDEWYGTGNYWCDVDRSDVAGYWCTMEGLPGT